MIQPSETVIDLLLETGGGGAGRHVLDLYAGLVDRGWPTRLIVSLERADPKFLAELREIDPEHVVEIPMNRSVHWSDVPAALQLRRMYFESPQRRLLHAHSTKAGIIGTTVAGLAAATVYTPHAYRAMDPTLKHPAKGGIWGAEAVFSRAYDRIVAVSPAEYEHTMAMGIPEERVRHIPNGVDYERLYAGLPPRATATGRFVIGFIGRLVYQKNPELFLEAAALIHQRGIPITAVIVGDGPLHARLVELGERLGITSILEWRDPHMAIDALADMDVVVHTSRYESFPYTLLEAAAALTPIVAVRNFGSDAILADVYPEALVSSKDPADIADCVTQFLMNDAARSSYVQVLRRVRERYSVRTMVDDTVKLYEELLSSR